jgi:hypothetical protein
MVDLTGIDSTAELLASLVYHSATFGAGGRLGHQYREQGTRLYTTDRWGRLVVPLGCLPRLVARIEQAGHKVEIEQLDPPNRRLQPSARVLRRSEGQWHELLETVAANPMGRIVVADDKELICYAALIIGLFGRARVIVATATRRRAGWLYRELSRSCMRDVTLHTGGYYDSPPPVTVCLLSQLYPHDCDLLILADMDEAIGRKPMDYIARGGNQRVYGMQRPGPCSRRTQLLQEALAGPVIYTAPGLRDNIEVLVVESVEGPRRIKGQSALDAKRAQIWRNAARNELIAQVALDLTDRAEPYRGRWPAVTILVDSVEHGRASLEHLPQWQLLHCRTPADKARLKLENVTQAGTAVEYAAYTGVTLHRYILTTTRAEQMGSLHTDIVIWAPGSSGIIDTQALPPRSADGSPRPMVIVDFVDRSEPGVEADSRGRLQQYEQRGFQVHTFDSK